jgi:hypothetical protein
MFLFNRWKLLALALILMIAFPLVAFAAEKKGTDRKKSVYRSSAKSVPPKNHRSPKVCKPSNKISNKSSVHRSSAKNVSQKSDQFRNVRKLKTKNPNNSAQFSSMKNSKEKNHRPQEVCKAKDEVSPPNLVQPSPAKNTQQKSYRPSQVSRPLGYTSSPERTNPDKGSENDVAAIWSTSDKNPEGKMNKQELCTYLNNNDLAEQTINSPDTKQKDRITKDYSKKNGEVLNNVVRITTPIAGGFNGR